MFFEQLGSAFPALWLLLFLATGESASIHCPAVGEQKMDRQLQQRRQMKKGRRGEGGREREQWGAMTQVSWAVERWQGSVSAAYPSVPFLLGVFVLMVVPSGCWPSLRGGILSFILSRPRASSKLRIFLVGEKP